MKLLITLFFIMSATQSMAGTRYGEDGGCRETGGQGGIGSVTITCTSGSTTTVVNNCSRSRGSWVCGSVIYKFAIFYRMEESGVTTITHKIYCAAD